VVLAQFARICAQRLREHDIIARLGGEEFVVLLPETDARHAGQVAEDLRGLIASGVIEVDGGVRLAITCSFGLASLDEAPDATLDGLLSMADKRLYRAKESGRNRVCID